MSASFSGVRVYSGSGTDKVLRFSGSHRSPPPSAPGTGLLGPQGDTGTPGAGSLVPEEAPRLPTPALGPRVPWRGEVPGCPLPKPRAPAGVHGGWSGLAAGCAGPHASRKTAECGSRKVELCGRSTHQKEHLRNSCRNLTS